MIQAQSYAERRTQGQLSLFLEPHLPWVSLRLKGQISSNLFREIHQQALSSSPASLRNCLLCDLSELASFTFPDQQWFSQQWLPETAQAGYQAVALVIPLVVIPAKARSLTVAMTCRGVQVLVAGELLQARQWLQSQG